MSNDGLSIKSNTSINSYDFSKINTVKPIREKFNLTNYSGMIGAKKNKENNYPGGGNSRFPDAQERDSSGPNKLDSTNEYGVIPKTYNGDSKIYNVRSGGKNIFE